MHPVYLLYCQSNIICKLYDKTVNKLYNNDISRTELCLLRATQITIHLYLLCLCYQTQAMDRRSRDFFYSYYHLSRKFFKFEMIKTNVRSLLLKILPMPVLSEKITPLKNFSKLIISKHSINEYSKQFF